MRRIPLIHKREVSPANGGAERDLTPLVSLSPAFGGMERGKQGERLKAFNLRIK